MLQPTAVKKSAPLPGTVIGGVYRVVKLIGEGAMGVVLLAHDTALQRSVAMKLIRPELASSSLRDRFLQEARAMARVSHPNVVQIYAFGDHEGAPYIAMELIPGSTLEDLRLSAPAGGVPDRDLVLRILDETCHGVSAIHAANTVHRDLKPTNILLDAEMRARVADFGVASATDG
ncbi:serine/threonine protein kinase, partial [bacterium]